jgi:hypothetical protein
MHSFHAHYGRKKTYKTDKQKNQDGKSETQLKCKPPEMHIKTFNKSLLESGQLKDEARHGL